LIKKEGFIMDRILKEILERFPLAEGIVSFYNPLEEILEEPNSVEVDADEKFSNQGAQGRLYEFFGAIGKE